MRRARVELDHPRRVRGGGIIKQQEVHSARLSGEHAEVHTVAGDGGAEGEASTRVQRLLRGSGFREFGLHFFKAFAQRHVALPEEPFIGNVLCWH